MKCIESQFGGNEFRVSSAARHIDWHNTILLLLLLALSACGGGGSGNPATSEETPFQFGLSGPGDSENRFPLAVGNFWIYQGAETSTNGILHYHNVAYVDRTVQQQGVDAVVVMQTNELAEGTSDTYQLVDAHGVATLGSSDPKSPDALLAPYWNALFPTQVGDRFVQLDRTNIDFGEDLDSDSINERADIRSEVFVQSISTISSILTDYPDALRLDRSASFDLRLSANGSQLNLESTESVYLVPSIGVAKHQVQINLDGESTTTVETLAAYSISGSGNAGYASITGAVTEHQVDGTAYFSLAAVKGERYVVALTGINGAVDLIPLLPNTCLQANTASNGSSPQDCFMQAATNRLLVAVESSVSASFVLAVANATNSVNPANEVRLDIVADQLTAAQVGPRGTSRYAATGLVNGQHTVSILGLSGDADLHVYADDTYSLELDCTLRGVGDINSAPEECTVDATSNLYFQVSSGQLNTLGATFFILVN